MWSNVIIGMRSIINLKTYVEKSSIQTPVPCPVVLALLTDHIPKCIRVLKTQFDLHSLNEFK